MYKVIKTKHYSIKQMLNMARNLSIKYNEPVDLDRIFSYNRKDLDKSPKLIFILETGFHIRYKFKSWKQLQDKYDKLMK